MTDQVIVRRYASVLYERTGGNAGQDMRLIHDALEGAEELKHCLDSPVIPRKRKRAILEKILEDHVQDTTLQFLRFLVERKREKLLPAIALDYQRIRDEHLDITRVHVRVRYALAPAEQERIQQALEGRLGTKVRLHVVEDDTLIGGIILRIGDLVYDGSITNQLAQLRKLFNRQEV